VNLQDWIGRRETRSDTLSQERVAQIAACFDRDAPTQALPSGWHWGFFNPAAKQSELGPDGHPKRGGFLPPVALERRMWAGGTLATHAPLPVGAVATRVSTVRSVAEKQGSSGALVFVTVDHAIRVGDTLCLEETHDIVYRAPGPAGAASAAPGDAAWRERRVADAVLLFRYSAVTFNGHRIHYDRAYAQNVEAYPGLVVHGPLLATLLQEFAERCLGRKLKRFSFRNAAPVFDGEAFDLCGKPGGDFSGGNFWIAAGDGRLIQRAAAE